MKKEAVYTLIGTVISWSLGFLGGDRFYKGEIGWGIFKLLTLGGLGVWYLVEALMWTAELGRVLRDGK
jgi:TM2 domain-containing membrane protein YozV